MSSVSKGCPSAISSKTATKLSSHRDPVVLDGDGIRLRIFVIIMSTGLVQATSSENETKTETESSEYAQHSLDAEPMREHLTVHRRYPTQHFHKELLSFPEPRG